MYLTIKIWMLQEKTSPLAFDYSDLMCIKQIAERAASAIQSRGVDCQAYFISSNGLEHRLTFGAVSPRKKVCIYVQDIVSYSDLNLLLSIHKLGVKLTRKPSSADFYFRHRHLP